MPDNWLPVLFENTDILNGIYLIFDLHKIFKYFFKNISDGRYDVIGLLIPSF